MELFLGLKKEFETTVVNEPSVFEPLKLYCIMNVCLKLFGVVFVCLFVLNIFIFNMVD